MDNLEENFNKIANAIKSSDKKFSDEQAKKLYGLYKQSIVGDVDESKKPYSINIIASQKYNSWLKYKGLSKEESMKEYILYVNEILKNNNK